MKRKYIATIFIVIILISSYFVYEKISTKIPIYAPKTIIKYNEKNISTSLGDYYWINNNTDNGHETGVAYDIGIKTPKFDAKPGDKVQISIPKSPFYVRVNQILNSRYKIKEYTPYKDGKEYIFTLPTEKGIYVFEVYAKWDKDKHNTATIFRVSIE